MRSGLHASFTFIALSTSKLSPDLKALGRRPAVLPSLHCANAQAEGDRVAAQTVAVGCVADCAAGLQSYGNHTPEAFIPTGIIVGDNRSVRLLIFSDIHDDVHALHRLMAINADYYISAGDLSNFGRGLQRAGEVLRARAGRVYSMPGNHESAIQNARFCELYGLHDLHEKAVQLGGWHVAGLGYSNPTPFATPGEFSEAQLAKRLELFAALDPLLLICHAPPAGTKLDRIREGLHAGSKAVRDFIAARQPRYFFCGHIHEAAGASEDFGATHAVNVGKHGYLLELK